MATATEKRDQLRRLMKGIDIAMFTTYGEDGFPVSRPLSTQEAEFDGRVLWFFVRRSSAKVAEIARNPRVNVAYASQDRNVYLSVAGTAAVVDDPARIDQFWNDAMKAFFPGGRTDPDLVLIRVAVHTVEYWDGPSTLIGKAIAFVIARVRKDDSAMGDSGQLRLAAPKRSGTPAKRGTSGARTGARATTRTADGRKVAGDRQPKAGATAARKRAPAKTPARKSASPGRGRSGRGAAG